MALNLKITDNELWEMLDGQLPEAQARLIRQAAATDSKLGRQLARVQAERAVLLALPTDRPGPDFSKKLMAQLIVENLVTAPQLKWPDWLLRGGLAGFGLILIVLLSVLIQNLPGEPVFKVPEFQLPTDLFDIFQQPVFLWTMWLTFLIPALFLLERKLVELRLI